MLRAVSRDLELDEASIAALGAALAAREVSALELAQEYLERIRRIDQDGPRLRSVLEVNPEALEIARRLDGERGAGRARGPLHGIPLLVKDNIDTADRMLTTAGSLALTGSRPARDATVETFFVTREHSATFRAAPGARAAAQDQADRLAWQRLREGGDVEREQHLAAHRIDVAHRIGRGDRAPVVRIVNERPEEVDGQHYGLRIVQPVDSGVVRRCKPDQQVWAASRQIGKVAQDVRQHRRAHLAGAPGAGREGG